MMSASEGSHGKGLPYMMSTSEERSWKSKRSKGGCVNSIVQIRSKCGQKGGGQKIWQTSYLEAPLCEFLSIDQIQMLIRGENLADIMSGSSPILTMFATCSRALSVSSHVQEGRSPRRLYYPWVCCLIHLASLSIPVG